MSPADRRSTVVAAALIAALAAGFAALTLAVARTPAGPDVDRQVMDWFVAQRRDWLTPLLVAATHASGRQAVAVAALAAAALLWWRRRRLLPAVVVAGTCAAAGLIGVAVKHLAGVDRPPPAVHVVAKTGPAFPSGHVTYSLALLGILAVVLGAGRSTRVRAALAAAVAAITGLIGVARLYLGVHWFTDVVGGVLLALAVIGTGALVLRAGQTGSHARTARG
ncbi:phosphatase PAP2 family protein [Mycolicibacillus trivialis]|uniref:phosphatase PAP2 family protein n=1 Tax=Mycolicibacillus trivialis TaxID=1798 RepID=UPI001056A994|nr:phosphatase PAP2 family protein [Mycolicibacillus trivialis]